MVKRRSPVAIGILVLLRTSAMESRFSCGTGSSKKPMSNCSTARAARTALPAVLKIPLQSM